MANPQGIVTMPWDLNKYFGKKPTLPSETISSRLYSRRHPSLPSPLFTIPQDIFKNLLDRMTKGDAFRLSLTCKSFMWHPVILKAIFREPISSGEIELWYRQLPDFGTNPKMMVGPSVTSGINK